MRTLVSQSYALANHTHPNLLPGDGDTGAFNAVSYGVDNTGSKDVTAITEAFFAAAVAAGKPAYFPPGTYMMQVADVPADCQIVGSGPSTILKLVAGAADSGLFRIQGDDVSIYNLTIDGNRGTGVPTTGAVVYAVPPISRFRAERVRFQNTAATAIWVGNPIRQIVVTDCDFVDMEGAAVLVECYDGAAAPHDVEVSRCRFDTALDWPYGFVVKSNTTAGVPEMYDVRITDNYMKLPGNFDGSGGGFGNFGVEVWGSQVAVTGNMVMYDSTTTGDEVGLSVVAGDSLVANNVVVNAGLAIEAGGSVRKGIVVNGNVMRGCRNGISSFGTPERVAITNNVVTGFTEWAIMGSENSTISGNTLYGSSYIGSADTIGVALMNSWRSSERAVIVGNTIGITNIGPGSTLGSAFRLEGIEAFTIVGNAVSCDVGVNLSGVLGETHTGVIAGNDFSGAGAGFAFYKTGASTDATVRWANDGDIPSRAAYASTDALLIDYGVITA